MAVLEVFPAAVLPCGKWLRVVAKQEMLSPKVTIRHGRVGDTCVRQGHAGDARAHPTHTGGGRTRLDCAEGPCTPPLPRIRHMTTRVACEAR